MMADILGPVAGMFASNLQTATRLKPEFDFMDCVTNHLLDEDNGVTVEQHLLMGTLIYNIRALKHFASRLPASELRSRLLDFGRKEITREIEWMADHLTEMFGSLD